MAIPQTFDEAFTRVKELVSIFQHHEERYLSPGYSEAQARLDFIDKFWIALGWDLNHEHQTDPYKQEVKVERGVATSEFRKRAAYAFLAPNPKIKKAHIEAVTIHTLDLTNTLERVQHDRFVQLVDQMLKAKQQLASARTERDQTFYESKCATLDRQIDNLVYELYDLTPEE